MAQAESDVKPAAPVIEIGARTQSESANAPAVAAPQSPPPGTQFQLEPVLPAWMLLALLVLLALGIQRAYTRTTRRVVAQRRLALAAIRLSAVLVLMLCLARPVLVKNYELREEGLCVLALDTSSSMEMRDGPGGKSRWETAHAILNAQQKQIAQLEEKFEVQRYAFDGAPRRTAQLPGEPPKQYAGAQNVSMQSPAGSSTDLSALFDTVAAEASGVSAAGALIISDGRHNTLKDVIPSALALQRTGVPVFCVGIGFDATPSYYRDVRIRDLMVPEKAFIGSRMIIRVEVESTLPGPAVSELTIDVAGRKIYQANVLLKQGMNVVAAPVEVPHVPAVLGAHRVVATLGELPSEADTDNNSRSAFFRVYRSKLGIWYVEGAMRKEFGAIRSALETAPNVKFKALNAFTTRTSNDKELLPVSAEDQSQLRLVIIGDLASDRFDYDGLRALAKWVEEGGAVLMIGGLSNFGPGKWHHSPLEPVLPVEMTLADGFVDGPLRIEMSNTEQQHPVLAIGDTPAQCEKLWRVLPPLPGINKVKGVKPAARVLLRADSRPLLVVQEYGKGRSAAFTADMTWQWILKADQGDVHKRFWRNLATWLTRSDYRDTDKAVFADAERLHCETGQEAAFHAFVHATEKVSSSIKDARIVLSLSRIQHDSETVVFKEDAGRGPGEFHKVFTPNLPGNYRFKAAAIGVDGSAIDTDSVDIQVTAPNLEQDNPKANLKLLRRIAEMTGGAYFDADKAGDAFDALLKRQAGYSKPVSGVTELWNHPFVMVLFMMLLTFEWSIRKRWGLI